MPLRGKKRYFRGDDDDDKFETEAFAHLNDDDVEPESKTDQDTKQAVDGDEPEMTPNEDSDDEAPDDVGFHESRESVLSQLRSALKQVDVEKQRKKEKRKLIDDHFKQQKLKKKEELAKSMLSDDILESIDDAIPKKVKKTIQEDIKAVKQQKRKRKSREEPSGEVEAQTIQGKEDYISFTDELSGVEVASMKLVEKQSKSAAQVAAEFRTNRLYGKHVVRESNKKRLAKKEKRRHRTT